jgi:hypothetical protein
MGSKPESSRTPLVIHRSEQVCDLDGALIRVRCRFELGWRRCWYTRISARDDEGTPTSPTTPAPSSRRQIDALPRFGD